MKSLGLCLLISLVVISCGEEIQTDPLGGRLNRVVELTADDNLSSREKSQMADFCRVLGEKETLFSATFALNSANTIAVETGGRTCIQDEVELATVQAQVGEINGRLLFTGQTLSFNDILTANSGELRTICENVNEEGDIARFEQSGSNVRWFYVTDESSRACGDDATDSADLICVEIRTGTRLTSGAYRIDNIEFLRTTTDANNLRGVILHRREISSELCDGTDSSEKVQNVNSL